MFGSNWIELVNSGVNKFKMRVVPFIKKDKYENAYFDLALAIREIEYGLNGKPKEIYIINKNDTVNLLTSLWGLCLNQSCMNTRGEEVRINLLAAEKQIKIFEEELRFVLPEKTMLN